MQTDDILIKLEALISAAGTLTAIKKQFVLLP